MASDLTWLPDIICLEDFDGNWADFLAALYDVFCKDFKRTSAYFRAKPISLKKYPMVDGKEATFWHVIQEGDYEPERFPNLRRCERIPWIRPVIDHEGEAVIKVWPNERRGEQRVVIWLENRDFVVVLAKRRTYWVLWTAYLIDRKHGKDKLQKEYEANRFKPL